jgi:predicted NUDIX family NTP pyrophosphohydrolase
MLVYRRQNGLEVLLVHPGGPYWAKRDEAAWSIPKGVVESDDLLACARREFTEETGLSVAGEVTRLSPVKQKSGKTVHAFAVEADLDLSGCCSNTFDMEWPPRSGKRQSFPEVDRVEYFDLATALKKIHLYQRPLLLELSRRLTE